MKGNIEKLKESIKIQQSFLDKPQFDDSFKGIFGPFSYNAKDVQITRETIIALLEIK